jgi:phosphohistidine swiveling domain-containing protein
MAMLEINGKVSLPLDLIGGKAFGLNRLMSIGMHVPPTIVIPSTDQAVNIDPVVAWMKSVSGPNLEAWPLAIRSSAVAEDSEDESKAGRYLSLLGAFDRTALSDAINRVRRSGPDMSVIVQPLLAPLIAGVAFSCDPLSYARNEIVVAWTHGFADRLVAGDESGNRVVIGDNDDPREGTWPVNRNLLHQLAEAIRAVENLHNGPVDIEWVIDQDQKLWLVQARRVILPKALHIHLDSAANFERLANLVKQHPKIRLRRQAFERGVMMAPAIVEWWSSRPPTSPLVANDDLGKPAGVSVVLLHPERVQRQIVREFASVRGCDVDFFTRGCRRYSIRRYPRSVGVTAAKESVLKAGLANSWVSVAIVQAVWDAYATGIIRRANDGYLIELAQGHFVPKGVVPTSTIVLDDERRVISTEWREQPTAYRFIDGHVVTETPPEQQLHLDAPTLGVIATAFDPLFELYKDAALEFGIIDSPDGYRPYLIDVAEGDTAGLALDNELIRSGVLSMGKCRGRTHRVNLSAIGALDSHLHDRPEEASVGGDNVVIVAERASVDLLPFVGAPGVVGFVFERGSILAHLAVVLREKGIPAVAIEDRSLFESLPDNIVVEVDASERSLSKTARINLLGALHDRGHHLVHQS